MEQQRREPLDWQREYRRQMDERPVSGEHLTIPRPGLEPVEVTIYRPKEATGQPVPVLFNMHGGAFLGGDAVLMDSFCRMVADNLPMAVVNINYRKAPEYAFPYAITEVADAVAHFASRAGEYCVDPQRMAVGGFSAGASLAAGAALKLLRETDIALACQLLVYPCTDLYTPMQHIGDDEASQGMAFMVRAYCQHDDCGHLWASPLLGSDEELAGVCPAVVLTCGQDDLREQGEAYAQRLIDCGVPTSVRRYQDALHGFIEVNRPDYPADDARRSPEQEALTRCAEQYILRALRLHLF